MVVYISSLLKIVQIASDICEIFNLFPSPPSGCVVRVRVRRHDVKGWYILLVFMQPSPPFYI